MFDQQWTVSLIHCREAVHFCPIRGNVVQVDFKFKRKFYVASEIKKNRLTLEAMRFPGHRFHVISFTVGSMVIFHDIFKQFIINDATKYFFFKHFSKNI